MIEQLSQPTAAPFEAATPTPAPAPISEPVEVRLPFASGNTPARSDDGEAASPGMVVSQIYTLLWHGFFRAIGWWLLSVPLAVAVALILLYIFNVPPVIVLPVVIAAVVIGLIAVILLKPVVHHITPFSWQLIAHRFGDEGWLLFDTLKRDAEDEADSYHIPRADQSRLLDRANAALKVAPLDQEEISLDAQADLIEHLTEIAAITAAQDFEDQVSYALATDGEPYKAVAELLRADHPHPTSPTRGEGTSGLASPTRGEESVDHPHPTSPSRGEELALSAATLEPLPAVRPAQPQDMEPLLGADPQDFSVELDDLFPTSQPATPAANGQTPPPHVTIASQPAMTDSNTPHPTLHTPHSALPTVLTSAQYAQLTAELSDFAALADPLLGIWAEQREGLGAIREWAGRWAELAGQWRKQSAAHTIEVEEMVAVSQALFDQVADELAAEIRPEIERVVADRQQLDKRTRELAAQQIARVEQEFGSRIATEQQLQGELTTKEAKQSEQVMRLEQRERSEEATIKRLQEELRQRSDAMDQRLRLAHKRVREAAKVAYHSESPRLVVNQPGRTDPLAGGPAEVLSAVQRRVRGMENNLQDMANQVADIRDRFETVREEGQAIDQPSFPYPDRIGAIKLLANDALKLRGELQPFYEDAVDLSRRAESLSRDLSGYVSGLRPNEEGATEEYASARNRLNQTQAEVRGVVSRVEGLGASQLFNQIDTFVGQYTELSRALPQMVQDWTAIGRELDATTSGIGQTQAEHQRAVDALNTMRQQLEESEQTVRELSADRDHQTAAHEAELHERLAMIAEDATRQQTAIRAHLTTLEAAHKQRQDRHHNLLATSFHKYLNFDAESMELKSGTVADLLQRIGSNLERASGLVQATQKLLDRCLISNEEARTLLPAVPINLNAPTPQPTTYHLQFPVWLTEYKTWMFGRRSYYLLTPVEVAMTSKRRWGGSAIELHPRSEAAQTLFERRADPERNPQIVRLLRRNSLLASRDGRDNLRAATYELSQAGLLTPLLAGAVRFVLGWRNLFDFAPREQRELSSP